jgi:sugar phosphate isomerase/epimerase
MRFIEPMRGVSGARVFASLGPFWELAVRGELRSGRDLARRAVEIGLDGLELNPLAIETASRAGIRIDPNELRPLGLSLHSNHVDFNAASPNSFIRDAAVEQLGHEIEYADRLGISTLTFHPGLAKKLERAAALDLLWSTLDRVVDRAGSVLLCLENMDHKEAKLCNLESEIEATLDRFPSLRLTVDLAHLGLRGADIAEFLDRFETRVAHVHVSGVIAGVPHASVSLERSHLDMSPHIERLADRDLVFVVENGSQQLLSESLSVLRRYCPSNT